MLSELRGATAGPTKRREHEARAARDRGRRRREIRANESVSPRAAPTKADTPEGLTSWADSLDALSASWRAALDTAQAALQAAGAVVPAGDLQGRATRLRSERAETARALEGLARDRRVGGWYSDLEVPAANVRRLLGLGPTISACVFNLDGVLVGSAAVHAAAWADTFNEFIAARVERTGGRFAAFDTRADYYEHLHGKSRLEGVRAFLASRGIRLPEGDRRDPPGSETLQGLARRKRDVLLRRIEGEGLGAFAGSRRYLQLSHDAGIRRAVVSASANTPTILERTGLAGLIEGCVDGNTVLAEHLRGKPAPDTLLAACRQLGVEPEHAAAFETGPAGVAAARAAGFGLVILITEAVPRPTVDGRGPDVLAPSLHELLERQLATSRGPGGERQGRGSWPTCLRRPARASGKDDHGSTVA